MTATLRPLPLLPLEEVRAAHGAATPAPLLPEPAAVVAGRLAAAAEPTRDVEVAAPRLDTAGRLQLTAVARRLGWRAGEPVPAVVDLAARTLTLPATPPADGLVTACGLDTKGRLTLPAALRHALGLRPGDQALVVALDAPDRALLQPVHTAVTALCPTQDKETPR